MTIRTLSRMLLGAGISLIVFALFKDVSHEGYFNWHKASQQSNQLMLGGFIFLAGIVAMVATRSKDSGETALPPDVQSLSIHSIQPEFAGEMAISSPPYQLFLTRQFSIQKNATLEKYVIGDDVFDTLEESLREADRQYQARLSEIRAGEERVHREEEELKQKLVAERAEQIEREAKEKAERERLEVELRPIREAQQKKIFRAAGGVIALLFVLLAGYLVNQQRKASALAILKAEQKTMRAAALLRMYSTGVFFGSKLGSQDHKWLVDAPENSGAKVYPSDGADCSLAGCSLTGVSDFVPAVRSVRFKFCNAPANREIDGRLKEVILIYEDADEAAQDFETLRQGLPAGKGVGSSIAPKIYRESAKVSFEAYCGT